MVNVRTIKFYYTVPGGGSFSTVVYSCSLILNFDQFVLRSDNGRRYSQINIDDISVDLLGKFYHV